MQNQEIQGKCVGTMEDWWSVDIIADARNNCKLVLVNPYPYRETVVRFDQHYGLHLNIHTACTCTTASVRYLYPKFLALSLDRWDHCAVTT